MSSMNQQLNDRHLSRNCGVLFVVVVARDVGSQELSRTSLNPTNAIVSLIWIIDAFIGELINQNVYECCQSVWTPDTILSELVVILLQLVVILLQLVVILLQLVVILSVFLVILSELFIILSELFVILSELVVILLQLVVILLQLVVILSILILKWAAAEEQLTIFLFRKVEVTPTTRVNSLVL